MNAPVALCLCRDQPDHCLCTRRDGENAERLQRVMRSMRFGLMVAAGMATPPAPHHDADAFPVGYDERDALV